MGIHGFPDIGTDAGSRADELIGQNAFPFGMLDLIAHFDNFQRKCLGFILKRTVHNLHPKNKIRAALRHTLLLRETCQELWTDKTVKKSFGMWYPIPE